MNQKDERILKLHRKGLTNTQIARKIGQPTPEGIERVRKAIERNSAGPRGEN